MYLIVGSGLSGSVIAERIANVLHSTVNNEKNLYYQCANIFETIYKIFGTKIHPKTICIFGAGAQFIVSKESILSRTKNFYENIRI